MVFKNLEGGGGGGYRYILELNFERIHLNLSSTSAEGWIPGRCSEGPIIIHSKRNLEF